MGQQMEKSLLNNLTREPARPPLVPSDPIFPGFFLKNLNHQIVFYSYYINTISYKIPKSEKCNSLPHYQPCTVYTVRKCNCDEITISLYLAKLYVT